MIDLAQRRPIQTIDQLLLEGGSTQCYPVDGPANSLGFAVWICPDCEERHLSLGITIDGLRNQITFTGPETADFAARLLAALCDS